MSDILDRLNDSAAMHDPDDVDLHLDAADEITRLRAENERLRVVLKDLANYPFQEAAGMRDRARAALKENSNE